MKTPTKVQLLEMGRARVLFDMNKISWESFLESCSIIMGFDVAAFFVRNDLKIKCYYKLTTHNAMGELQVSEGWNLVTTVGFEKLMFSLVGTSSQDRPERIDYAAIGTGTAAASVGDTALGNLAAGVAISSVSYNATNKQATLIAQFQVPSDGVTRTISEAGLSIGNPSDAGTFLFSRLLLSPAIVQAGQRTATFEATLTVS